MRDTAALQRSITQGKAPFDVLRVPEKQHANQVTNNQ